MHIGQIGHNFKTTEQIEFRSKTTLFDFDALIIDLNSISVAYSNSSNYGKERVFVQHKKDEFFGKRQNEILSHYNLGKPIIYFTPIPQIITFHGENDNNNILQFCPFKNKTASGEGKRIEIISKTKFTPFFEKYQNNFFYDSFFEDNSGTPIACIVNTKKVISCFSNKVLFLPKVKNLSAQDESDFLKGLLSILLQNDSASFSLPDWTRNYLLPAEKELTNNLKTLETQYSELKKKIKETESDIQDVRQCKTLFSGDGKALEDQVRKVFQELGFEIIESEHNRSDLIMKWKQILIILEIKGVNGTAAEKQAAQLEKWCSEYQIEHGVTPKGILLVNTFKDKPIIERNEVSWPNQMLKYSMNRGHCLITSLQLLCLYFECKKNPAECENIINSVLETDGIYSNFLNWQSFIETL